MAFLRILFHVSLIALALGCSCPKHPPKPPMELGAVPGYTVQDEIFGTENYGKQVSFGKLIFLERTEQIIQGYSWGITYKCPEGYRLPYLEEIKEILDNLKDDADHKALIKGLGLEEGKNYVTSNKTHPEDSSPISIPAYEFEKFSIDNGKVKISTINVAPNWYGPSCYSKCVKPSNTPFKIIVSDSDFSAGTKVHLTLDSINFNSILWKYDKYYTTRSEFTRTFKETGCHQVELWAKNVANEIVYTCQKIYIGLPLFNKKKTTISPSKIKTVEFPNIPMYSIPAIFFDPAAGPIAPKFDGGFYLFFAQEIKENVYQLHIAEFDKDMNLIVDKDLEREGRPTDICATEWGFAILYAFRGLGETVSGYYSDYTERFTTTLFINDYGAFKLKDQIRLYSEEGSLFFGQESMYRPSNGKIMFTNGVFSIAFDPYNNFNALGIEKNGHTGDMFITLDENGENERHSWTWGASHSLIQTMVWTGKYLVYAALSDGLPHGFQATALDPTVVSGGWDDVNKRYTYIPYSGWVGLHTRMPGDTIGNTCGRMGSVVYNGEMFAVPFAVKPCSGKDYTEEVDEVGIVTFKLGDEGKIIDVEKKVFPNITGVNMIQIRNGKYGKNIFIVLGYDAYQTNLRAVSGYQLLNHDQKVKYLLCDFKGKIISGPFDDKDYILNFTDDFRELKDGTLVWATPNKDKKLRFTYIKP